MAKNRLINTRFWSDPYIQSLSLQEKLLYLYLISNPHTEICGVYEITEPTISFESGIPISQVKLALKKFEKDGKIYSIDSLYIAVINFSKHQQSNPKVAKGIERTLSNLPEKIRLRLEEIDRLSKSIDSLSYLNPNLNLNSNLSVTEKISPTPSEIAEDFFARGPVYQATVDFLEKSNMPRSTAEAEIGKFIDYWTEPSKTGKKLRWHLQKTFEVRRRLTTWLSNAKEFKARSGGLVPAWAQEREDHFKQQKEAREAYFQSQST